ncbi:MAG: hypothetical protein O6928_08155 [Gammaproteobacteria bacterium]|nr:hypothetical protein [Gammaproteobacteria bacterium]
MKLTKSLSFKWLKLTLVAPTRIIASPVKWQEKSGHSAAWYDPMDGGGRVESGTETERIFHPQGEQSTTEFVVE